ncbi:hypothetical protein D3C79_1008930 [compost metagenome]
MLGHHLQRLGHGDGVAIGALGGDGVEDVGGGDDASLQSNLCAAESPWVALAIEPFMMSPGHLGQLPERPYAAQDLLGIGGMHLHRGPLLRI